MATQTLERLISSDDHVDLSHEDVKKHLTPKLHDDYDEAVLSFRRSMVNMVSSESNQRWREQEGLAPDPTVSRLNAGGLPVVLRAMVLGPSMVSDTVTFGRAEPST